jgi:hypothetical protein
MNARAGASWRQLVRAFLPPLAAIAGDVRGNAKTG